MKANVFNYLIQALNFEGMIEEQGSLLYLITATLVSRVGTD